MAMKKCQPLAQAVHIPLLAIVTPQTSGNFNGQVLLSEILAKLEIPDFQTLDLQTICGP